MAALNSRLLSEQNLPLGIAAAVGAGIVGALIWMGITVALKVHVGYVALGVGALVGFATRYAGKGIRPIFGVVGAVVTLLACLAGEVQAAIYLAADANGMSFTEALSKIDYGTMLPAILESSSPISYLIYAIGVWEGYKFSFRKLSPEELHQAGV